MDRAIVRKMTKTKLRALYSFALVFTFYIIIQIKTGNSQNC